jgi:drug/metabolite transporter (DMT)-like permease
MTSSKDLTLGVALAAVTGALWGLVFLAPELTTAFSPLLLVAGRYIAYGAMALLLALPRWSAIRPLLTGRNLAIAFVLSILGNTLYYSLLANAITLAGVPISTLIIGFMPVTVAIVGSMRKGALPIRSFAPALLLAVAAIVIISVDALAADGAGGSAPILGLLLAIAALFSWTAFAVGNSYALEHRPGISARDWNLILGVVTGFQGLCLLPLALQARALPTDGALWLQFILICVVIAFLASLVANALWNQVSRLLPLTLIGPLVVFETLFALLYGFVWEGRMPDTVEYVAIALMLASVIASVRAHRPVREELTPHG